MWPLINSKMIFIHGSRTKNLIKIKRNEYCFFLEYVNREQISWYFKNYADINLELFNLSNAVIIFIISFIEIIHKSQMLILVRRKNLIPQIYLFLLLVNGLDKQSYNYFIFIIYIYLFLVFYYSHNIYFCASIYLILQ